MTPKIIKQDVWYYSSETWIVRSVVLMDSGRIMIVSTQTAFDPRDDYKIYQEMLDKWVIEEAIEAEKQDAVKTLTPDEYARMYRGDHLLISEKEEKQDD